MKNDFYHTMSEHYHPGKVSATTAANVTDPPLIALFVQHDDVWICCGTDGHNHHQKYYNQSIVGQSPPLTTATTGTKNIRCFNSDSDDQTEEEDINLVVCES